MPETRQSRSPGRRRCIMNAIMMYDSTFGNTDEKIPLSIPHAYCDGFVIGKFPFVTAIRATPPRYRPAIEVQPFHRYRLPCVLSYQQSRAGVQGSFFATE